MIFIPSDNKQPVRYLITLNKTSNVRKLKSKLLELIGEESVDIVMAEVFDEHISRILVRINVSFFRTCIYVYAIALYEVSRSKTLHV